MKARLGRIVVSSLIVSLGCQDAESPRGDVLPEGCGEGTASCEDAGGGPRTPPARFGSLVGAVVDTGGAPLEDVRVRAGDQLTITDAGGHFVLEHLPAGDGPVVTRFEHAGYGTFVRRIELLADRVVHARAVLKRVDVSTGSRDPLDGFSVTRTDRVRLTVPAASLLDDEGNAVIEPVDVRIVTGDPTDPRDARAMPGDYLSDENGGTPLDSVSFFEATVRTATGAEVSRIDPAAPLVVERPVPAALRDRYRVGDTIPVWSFDEEEGFWRREGTGTVFDDGGTLWTRAEVTHLSWWNWDNPVDTHACVCVDVVDAAGAALEGAQVISRGVTYQGQSSPVYADEDGRACVTVKRSPEPPAPPDEVELFVQLGRMELPFVGNPVVTPSVGASCLRNIDCPDKCVVRPETVSVDASGFVSGHVTLRNGEPAASVLVSTDHGSSVATDDEGAYRLPVFVDTAFTVFAVGYTSPDLVATASEPEVVHDIALANVPPHLVELRVNGTPREMETNGEFGFAYVVEVDDYGAPVRLAATAIDADGDPIDYHWLVDCADPRSCDPADAPETVCDTLARCDPSGAGWYANYRLGLDDGHIDEPVEYTITVWQRPCLDVRGDGCCWEGDDGPGAPTGGESACDEPACAPDTGDGCCSAGETPCNSAGDCTVDVCGDGCCGGDETPSSCASDCPACDADGVCDAGENACACPNDDCGADPADGCCQYPETACTDPACAPKCGDGCCSTGENECNCYWDCEGAGTCGDGCCRGDERCGDCPEDCGACFVPVPDMGASDAEPHAGGPDAASSGADGGSAGPTAHGGNRATPEACDCALGTGPSGGAAIAAILLALLVIGRAPPRRRKRPTRGKSAEPQNGALW